MSFTPPPFTPVDGADLSFGLVAARYNLELVDGLLAHACDVLREAGVTDEAVEIVRVPGSNEVPVAAQMLASSGRFDACLGLGVLIRGDTLHYELIATASAQALQQVALETLIPVINGIVVAESQAQAVERCLGPVNRGAEFARAALEMARLRKILRIQ